LKAIAFSVINAKSNYTLDCIFYTFENINLSYLPANKGNPPPRVLFYQIKSSSSLSMVSKCIQAEIN